MEALQNHRGPMNIDALHRDGILYSSEIARLGDDPRELRNLARRGRMVRIRRGAYFPLEAWGALDERERHIVRIRAVLADRQSPAVVAGLSAAAVHGMPVLGTWPDDVTLLRPHAGGGKSEPGVRQTSAGGLPRMTDVVAGIEVTSLARTAIDLARTLEFPAAVASVDWVLASGRVTREQLWHELATTTLRAGRARVERVLEFAVEVSGSFGESMTRAVIHQLGFEAPELQREFTDAEGSMFRTSTGRASRRRPSSTGL